MSKTVTALLRALCNFLFAALRLAREALEDGGLGSLSRIASAALVGAYIRLMLVTRKVPEHSLEFAAVITALYGVSSFGGNLRDAAASFKSAPQAPAPAAQKPGV